MHEALGTLNDGLVRASFSLYNSEKQVNELLFALKEMALN
jgi:selenocysteine lyase/cysteine desulfurase